MRAHIVVGLAFGDEGKGATTDYLCRKLEAGLVVRYSGGAQAGHNVVLPCGHRHVFAQFGAGTFAVADTYLAQPVIIEPFAMKREAAALAAFGIERPFSRLSVHPRCLVATPLHKIANRLFELDRRHGSCGMGMGETRRYWLDRGSDAVFAEDLRNRAVLLDKLELLRQRLLIELAEYDVQNIRLFSPAEWMTALPSDLRTADGVDPCNHVVFEGAQGVLLDETYGFHPHTTWSDVTMRHALEVASLIGVDSIESKIGCVRPYMTRHGSGPLPTQDGSWFSDPGNPYNKWQGNPRFGHLDLPLLRYSASVLRHNGTPLTGLSVSCLDHITPGAKACVAYDRDLPDDGTPMNAERIYRPKEFAAMDSADDAIALLREIAEPEIFGYGDTHEDRTEREMATPRQPSP